MPIPLYLRDIPVFPNRVDASITDIIQFTVISNITHYFISYFTLIQTHFFNVLASLLPLLNETFLCLQYTFCNQLHHNRYENKL